MDAQKATLFQLVDGNKQFRIPIYQRAYSWRQEQCSRLLEDVLTISNATQGASHFIGSVVYVADGNAQVLEASGIHVNLACNTVAGGRTVYFSQLPYSLDNARLLLRALLWATRQEDALQRCHSTNPKVDCAFYPKAGVFCLANNVDSKQVTTVFDANGAARRFTLQPYQWRWEQQRG